MIMFLKDLSASVDAMAICLNDSDVTDKAGELHRLFDAASDSLFNLMAFARKEGVVLDDQILLVALNSMLRDDANKRHVRVLFGEREVKIDVDTLGSMGAARAAFAEQCGVSVQDLLEYDGLMSQHHDMSSNYSYPRGASIDVGCNHRGCHKSKAIAFGGPKGMVDAKRRAATEIWYCHHHRESAFVDAGALSDDLLPVLQRIQQSPGLSLKDTGAKRDDIAFLEVVGIIAVEKLMNGGRVLCYRISLTEVGRRALDMLQETMMSVGAADGHSGQTELEKN